MFSKVPKKPFDKLDSCGIFMNLLFGQISKKVSKKQQNTNK